MRKRRPRDVKEFAQVILLEMVELGFEPGYVCPQTGCFSIGKA